MKRIFVVVLIVLFQGMAEGQHSTGFEHPGNIQPVLQYRLPTWGYSSLVTDISSSGVGTHEHVSHIQALLNPVYDRYFESEKDIVSIYLTTDFRTEYDRSSVVPDTPEREMNVNYTLSGSWNHYLLIPRFFLEVSGNFYGGYTRTKIEDITQSRSNVASPSLGIGVGRIRNVTPAIRALRFNERLRSLSRELNLSATEIREVAHIIATFRGYNSVFDRPDKYFWQDFYSQISSLEGALSAFDYFYLNDTFLENLGQRLEGWDARLKLDYSNRYINPVASPKTSDSFGGVALVGRWYKNLSLAHQVGVDAVARYTGSLDEIASEYQDSDVQIRLSHLWVISDRLLLNSTLLGVVPLVEAEMSYYRPSQQYFDHYGVEHYTVQSTFSYFIENNVEINTSVNAIYFREDKRATWSYNLGIGFYLVRSLVY
ncbi:MAG TPA: hypothetical protein VKA68_10805 [bacterium]|nr:hypothetical protein [bacterium]